MPIRLMITVGNLGRGGAEKQLMSLLSHAPHPQLDITVVSFSRTADEYWAPTLRALPHRYIQVSESAGHVGRLRALRRHIRAHRPQVVWAWHFFTGVYVWALWSLGRKFSFVLGVRNEPAYLLQTHRWALWLVRRADVVVANAQMALDAFVDMGLAADRAKVLPNSVDVDGPSVRTTQARKVGMCGNVHPRKGIDVFLAAAVHLPEHSFVVAGQGDLTPYRQQAERLAIAERVAFHQDVTCTEEMAGLDIFVLPSRFEGIPNVLMEAMALGLPCVACRVGGVSEIAQDGVSALLVPPEDPVAIAAAVRRLAGSQQQRAKLGAAARHSMQDRRPDRIARTAFLQIVSEAANLRTAG